MKKILLTGATDGIGLEAAKMLVKEGHHLLLHGRSKEKLVEVEKTLGELNSDATVSHYVADLSDLAQVNAMAEAILKDHTALDVIINNAGVYVIQDGNTITKDNVDMRIMVNTIAPYVLTKKLLPLLGEESRVVNIASAAQMYIEMDKMNNVRPFSHDEAYAQSKMSMIIWTMELAEREKPVFVSVNPKSFLGSKMVKVAYGKEGYDLKIGGDILTRAAISPEFANANGKYYCNDNQVFMPPNAFALNPDNRATVMAFLDQF